MVMFPSFVQKLEASGFSYFDLIQKLNLDRWGWWANKKCVYEWHCTYVFQISAILDRLLRHGPSEIFRHDSISVYHDKVPCTIRRKSQLSNHTLRIHQHHKTALKSGNKIIKNNIILDVYPSPIYKIKLVQIIIAGTMLRKMSVQGR